MKAPVEQYDGKPEETGSLFVDILFALVVTQILTPLKDPSKTTWEGGWHLAVSFVLTILSWIGYHNSRSRADARLRFPTSSSLDERLFGKTHANDWHYFSFGQFGLDVAMVVVYWMSAITYERSTQDLEVSQDLFWYWPSRPSAVPEVAAVLASFLLYVAWDWVGIKEARYLVNKPGHELRQGAAMARLARRERRRRPTIQAAAFVTCLLVPAFFMRSGAATIVIDAVLIVALVWYRYAKEFVVADLKE